MVWRCRCRCPYAFFVEVGLEYKSINLYEFCSTICFYTTEGKKKFDFKGCD